MEYPSVVWYSSTYPHPRVGWDSIVSIVMLLGLDSPGIESQLGARFSTPLQTGPVAYPTSRAIGTVSFPLVKWLEFGVDPPPPSSAEIKGGVELYICSPSGILWPVLGRTLPLTFTNTLIVIQQTCNGFTHQIVRDSLHNSYLSCKAQRCVLSLKNTFLDNRWGDEEKCIKKKEVSLTGVSQQLEDLNSAHDVWLLSHTFVDLEKWS